MSEVSSFVGDVGDPGSQELRCGGRSDGVWPLALTREIQLLDLSCLVTSFKGEPMSGSRCLILNPKKAKQETEVEHGV